MTNVTNHPPLTASQSRLLEAQLKRCYRDVPHYRRLFDQLELELDQTSLALLQRLPILDKDQVRQDYDDFFSRRYDRESCKHSYSSGSTGEPFASYFDTASWYRKKVWHKLRARFACGMSLGDRVAILECDSEQTVQQRNKLAWLTDPLLKVRVFSLFTDSEQLLAQLRAFSPQNIYGYPSHLLKLATKQSNSDKPVMSVQRIFTASEYLKSGSRDFIGKAFSADVYDHYGCTEFKEIAWQCPQADRGSGYHINGGEVICEILDDQGQPLPPGSSGEIVVTELRNKAMPLLRYRMNDHGVMDWGRCQCGYEGPGLLPLGGRSSDYIVLPSGQQVSPYLITTRIENIDQLIQYQVEQDSPTSLLARTVWRTPPTAEQLTAVRSAIADAVGDSMELGVKICSSIELEQNGKFKVVKRSPSIPPA